MRTSSALVFTIGIFDEEDPDRNPGFSPRPLRTVEAVCEGIAPDIRHQSTLGCLSAGTVPPGAYRAIRVVAQARGGGKLTVRARPGCFGGNESRTLARHEETK